MDNQGRDRGSKDDVGQLTVCVDFDGVLNTYNGWAGTTELFEPREGVEEFLEALNEQGYRVVVHTTRKEISVAHWLEEHGLLGYVAAVSVKKPPAIAYVDDRAIPFVGDYDGVLDELIAFHPYWVESREELPGPEALQEEEEEEAAD